MAGKKSNPVGAALAEVVCNPLEHVWEWCLAALLVVWIVVPEIKKELGKSDPETSFRYAAQDALGKHIKAEGDCQDIRFDPSRGTVVIPYTCKVQGLDAK